MKKTLLLAFLAASCAIAQDTFNTLRVTGGAVAENGQTGGYWVFSPLSYNPYGGSPCLDNWGNPVQQPTSTTGAWGPYDLVVWNSLSPSMPFNGGVGATGLVQPTLITNPPTTAAGPCGIPLPVNQLYGINTNGYWFGRAGLATDSNAYNSIMSLQGGIVGNSLTMGVLYPIGTVVCTAMSGASCISTRTLTVPEYLGGHIDMGHSNGPVQGTTIAGSTNPFSGGEGNVQGQGYFDDGLGYANLYYGAMGGWHGIGAISDVYNCTATGSTNCVQQQGGTFHITGAGDAAFQSLALTHGLTVDAGAYGFDGSGNLTALSGVAPIFNCTATGGSSCLQQQSGTFHVTGAGDASFQSLALTHGLTVDAGAYGFDGSGNLTALSGVAPIFNCTATGASNCLQQQSGTFHVTGAGDAAFQSVALTNGLTVGSGAYGLTGGGVLTVASCTGCGGGGVNSFNTRTGAVSLSAADVAAVEQDLRTSAGPTFASVIAGLLNCTATGSSNCIQQQSGTFHVTGAGDASFQSLALTNGLTVDSGTYGLSGAGTLTAAGGSFGSGVAFNGGLTTGSSTNSLIYIGTGGNFYLRTGGSPSCFGITDGWFAYEPGTDQLWVCSGGVAKAH